MPNGTDREPTDYVQWLLASAALAEAGRYPSSPQAQAAFVYGLRAAAAEIERLRDELQAEIEDAKLERKEAGYGQ